MSKSVKARKPPPYKSGLAGPTHVPAVDANTSGYEARKALVDDRRFERMRALLPKLQLRYPNDLEVEQLARLAKVHDLPAFRSLMDNLILDAHLADRRLRGVSAVEIRKHLRSISRKASDLSQSLSAIDVGRGGSAENAGYLLEVRLADFAFRQGLMLIPEFEALLDAVSKAASEAARTRLFKRGPKGAGGNAAFNLFLVLLLNAALQKRGSWTIYKSSNGKWSGSLLEALGILKPYLPDDFFPPAELGRSVQHIALSFKKQHSPKNAKSTR